MHCTGRFNYQQRIILLLSSIIAISIGASAGATARWLLGLALNAIIPSIPLGTLAANLTGGYLIGLALSLFMYFPEIGAPWRLLIVTGFLGGLTTFSAFSFEVVTVLQQGRLLVATSIIGLHVVGSLVMTMLGLATIAAFRG